MGVITSSPNALCAMGHRVTVSSTFPSAEVSRPDFIADLGNPFIFSRDTDIMAKKKELIANDVDKDTLHVNAEIQYIDPNELIPYEYNARKHQSEVDYLANIMKKVGFPKSKAIEVDKNMVIINGHGRRLAAMKAGIKSVPYMVRDMSDELARAYRISDNRISDLSGWDYDVLQSEFMDLKALDIPLEDLGFQDMGFDDTFIDTGADEDDADTVIIDETVEEEEEEPQVSIQTDIKRGEIFQLGRHRVMCGDATSEKDVKKLMNGITADITFTSPPYNAGHLATGRTQDGKKYLNDEDERTEDEYLEFLSSNMDILLDVSKEVFYNLGVVSGSKRTIIRLLNAYVDKFKDFVYWKKANPVPAIAKNVISSAVELIMAFGENNTRSFNHDPGIYYGVIEGPKAGGEFREIHRATFPLYLPTNIIETFTDEGATVLDCFGGTGTTLIACENTGRTCYMMEIEPIYVQTIIDRWEKQTGQKAKKVKK